MNTLALAALLATSPFGLVKGPSVTGFPDGTQVRLDKGGKLVLAEEGSGLVVFRLLAGKAWARVAKNKLRRFEIRTPLAVAAVRGTEFTVEINEDGETVTQVIEGAVGVTPLRGDKPVGRETLVQKGETVSVSEEDGETLLKPLSAGAPVTRPGP